MKKILHKCLQKLHQCLQVKQELRTEEGVDSLEAEGEHKPVSSMPSVRSWIMLRAVRTRPAQYTRQTLHDEVGFNNTQCVVTVHRVLHVWDTKKGILAELASSDQTSTFRDQSLVLDFASTPLANLLRAKVWTSVPKDLTYTLGLDVLPVCCKTSKMLEVANDMSVSYTHL